MVSIPFASNLVEVDANYYIDLNIGEQTHIWNFKLTNESLADACIKEVVAHMPLFIMSGAHPPPCTRDMGLVDKLKSKVQCPLIDSFDMINVL